MKIETSWPQIKSLRLIGWLVMFYSLQMLVGHSFDVDIKYIWFLSEMFIDNNFKRARGHLFAHIQMDSSIAI